MLPGTGFSYPRAGDEGGISFPLKLPLASRAPRPKGRGIKIFAAKIFSKTRIFGYGKIIRLLRAVRR